jgi:hypothetical protein
VARAQERARKRARIRQIVAQCGGLQRNGQTKTPRQLAGLPRGSVLRGKITNRLLYQLSYAGATPDSTTSEPRFLRGDVPLRAQSPGPPFRSGSAGRCPRVPGCAGPPSKVVAKSSPPARLPPRRPPPLLAVPGELEVVTLARHADDDAANAEPAAEEGAEAGEDGRRAGRGVAPGAGGQHGEQHAAAAREVVTRRTRHRGARGRTAMKCSRLRLTGESGARRSARRPSRICGRCGPRRSARRPGTGWRRAVLPRGRPGGWCSWSVEEGPARRALSLEGGVLTTPPGRPRRAPPASP